MAAERFEQRLARAVDLGHTGADCHRLEAGRNRCARGLAELSMDGSEHSSLQLFDLYAESAEPPYLFGQHGLGMAGGVGV